jgi:hypothetical protein
MSGEFVTFPLRSGELLSLPEAGVRVWGLGGEPLGLEPGSTYWVMITGGPVRCAFGADRFTLGAACYLVAAETGVLEGGIGMVIQLAGYRGLRQVGGPLEPTGRLRYVDGCSDTLLVCPPRFGEPCLNHLHLPADTDQSFHTHDSLRLGLIARGAGECRTAAGATPLSPGLGWWIPAGLRHAFRTAQSSLDVFAWHPDSDFGPTDGNHPMINRTRLSQA